MRKYFMSMLEAQVRCQHIADAIGRNGDHRIYGVPRGGVPVAMMVAAMVGGRVVERPDQATVIVDDIIDSGRTKARHDGLGKPFYALVTPESKKVDNLSDAWIVFPWEASEAYDDTSGDDIGTRLLQAIGENPERGGLAETPKRFLAYMREATSGMGQDPKALLKVFEDGGENVDEMVVVAGIPFYSMCEHHLVPFFGQAHIAYIPGKGTTMGTGKTRIIGLSKLPRLLDVFAKRPQVQERITNQVADVLFKELGALGVGVVLRARHLCMEMRGVKKPGAITYTSALRGAIKDKAEARSEFLRFVDMADSRMGAI